MHLALSLLVFMNIFSIYNQYKISEKPTQRSKKTELKSSIDNSILKNILDDISSVKEDEIAIHNTKPTLFLSNLKKSSVTKRSNIERPTWMIDKDDDDGALIVVDVGGPKTEENADKKSAISDTNSEIYDGKGYSIVLNNNGDSSEEKVGQKDEIYYQMQAAYRDMEKEFSGIVREPRDPKKVRVIVITPKVENAFESPDLTTENTGKDNAENAVGRDQLPILPAANKSINNNNIGADKQSSNETLNTRNFMNINKPDLEMDIDKLRHVKEKLKLLNEDDDKVSDGLDDESTKKMTYKKDGPGEVEPTKYQEQEGNDDTAKLDSSATREVERQFNTLNRYSKLTNSDDVVKDSSNQIYRMDDLQKSNETEKPSTHTVDSPRILRAHLISMKHEQQREYEKTLRRNNTENVFYEPTTTTTRKFIEKLTNHEITTERKPDLSDHSKFSSDIISKDKLQLEKEITDQRKSTQLPTYTSTTVTSSSTRSSTKLFDSKKHDELIGNQKSKEISRDPIKSDSADNRKHEIAKYVQKLLQDDENNKRNMTKLLKASLMRSNNTNKTSDYVKDVDMIKHPSIAILKALIKSKSLDAYDRSSNSGKANESKGQTQSDHFENVNKEKGNENHVIPVSKNPHEISSLPKASEEAISHEVKTFRKEKEQPNPETEIEKSPTTRAFQKETTSKSARTINKRKAEAIIEFLNKDPLESWKYEFSTLRSLDLNSTILRSGLVNAGNIERLKGVMKRALEGKDITLSVVGGSISAGGGLYKDKGNIDGLYYKGVVDWWNKMISPLTGSQMKINNIAIGSIGTDYFSYCIKNHISEKTNIVLWELSANDFNRYKMQPTKGARPLERLTRMILELASQPALLYVNFFKGIDYKASRESCPNFEDQGEDIIAHYYKIPSLSWRSMVCGGLVRQEEGFKIESLFSQDQYHPSLRGHAQMSLLLLLHLRHVMRAVLQSAIAHDGYIENFEDLYSLPEPLFLGPKSPEPLCWTLITADMSEQITNTLSVRVNEDNGFKLEYATNFPIRFDKVICWKAEKPNSQVALQFYIPENYGSTGLKRLRSEVAITTHTRWGGSATLWIDDIKEKAVTIKEGRPNDPGKRTQVDPIANDIPAGSHTLNIKTRDKGFCLSAIMIDGS